MTGLGAMFELLLLILIAGYAFCLGRALLHAFGFTFATWAGRVAASVSLGLGGVAHIVLGVGLAGCLTREVVFATALLVLTTATGMQWLVTRWRGRGFHEPRSQPPGNPGPGFDTALTRFSLATFCQIFFGLVASLSTLTSALAPPTAGDALCYHLEIPKRFVEHAAVQYLPLTDNSLFPFHTEMLYTLALLIGTPVLAQLIHWLIGLLFALTVIELATPLLGRRGARWAAIVALLVPGVTNQMTAPLNDLAMALFAH
jgi:hypothetical protein